MENSIQNAQKSKPAYAAVADKLRQAIDANNIKPGTFLGTEVDLARREKLARMTVRRAVQVLVDEGRLERLPGRGIFARGTTNTTRTVRMLAGNLCWMPAVHMARGARHAAQALGVELILCDAHGNLDDDLKAIAVLPKSGARGAVLMSMHCRQFHTALCALVAAEFSFVVVDQHLHEIEAPSVCSNNFNGGQLAATALIQAGHGDLAFVGDLDASTTKNRFNGAAAACEAHNIPPPRAIDIESSNRLGDWEPQIKLAVARLMQDETRPTAIVCSCDTVARSAYRTLQALGLSIPTDVSIVGFDDDPLAEWLDPPLSTIRQSFDAIGEQALHLLVDRIANPNAPCHAATIPVSFVERASIAPPRHTTRKEQTA